MPPVIDRVYEEADEGLALLRSASTRAELQVAAAALEAEGIPSIVKGEMDSSMYPVGTVHLFVDADDLEAAREVIGGGEELEADFSYGPGVGRGRARRAGVVLVLVYLVVPLLILMIMIIVATLTN